jgi:hypothetical protein
LEDEEMTEFDPTENLIRNVKLFMTWRSLRNPDVARAMHTLGFPWHRKTVYRVLDGDRPVHIEEVYGLAVVFETTIGALLDPATADPHVSREAFGTGYTIGLMSPISLMQFRKFLNIPEDRLEKAEIGVRSWVSTDFVGRVPRWKTWPLSSTAQKLNAILKASGWDSLDDVVSEHPEGFDVLDDLMTFIADHPKSAEGSNVN